MREIPANNVYLNKFKGFNRRTLEYIQNSSEYVYNVLEGAVRSGKTAANIYAAAMAIEQSHDRLHAVMGYSAKAAIRNVFESDGLGLIYIPFWQGRLYTKASAPGSYSLILEPPKGSKMPVKEIIPLAGGDADSEASFRGNSFGIVIITEATILHPNSINALNERTYAADIRRFFIDFNPSSSTNFIYSFIGKKWLGMKTLPLVIGSDLPVGYVKKLPSGKKFKILQYMHCTFSDNKSLTPERIETLIATNDPDSPEYKRNILGLRANGAGKIYNVRQKNIFVGQIERAKYFRYVIVVDPGSSASETAFVLAALTNDRVSELHILNTYVHQNDMESTKNQKTDTDYAYDFFDFIKECESIMGMAPYGVIVDAAAISFIREYNRNARANGIAYFLSSSIKGTIDERIKEGTSLIYTGRLKFHKVGAERAIYEFENAEYDEKKSLNGKYERLDDPAKGGQIGCIDCTEYAIEAFSSFLFRPINGVSEENFKLSGTLPTNKSKFDGP